jgi:hypothetical protein
MLDLLKKPIKESLTLYWELLKVMVPTMIAVRVLIEFGLIEIISQIFTPFMDMVGLPAFAGIVWTTTMLVNIYAGLAALVSLTNETHMSIAQVSILGSMMLMAHGLPIEQRIVQKSGTSLIASTLLRICGALLYGYILNSLYHSLDILQVDATMSWFPQSIANPVWLEWAESSLISLFSIYWIILLLIIVLQILKHLKITDWISKTLSPLLNLMGISQNAIPITMIGVMLGLSYGGALVLREAKEGSLSSKDIFLSLNFMCLCHSLIEDTLLIFSIGGHLSAILLGRFIFSCFVVFLLAKLLNVIPEKMFYRYLFKKV